MLAGRCVAEMQDELDSVHCRYAPETDTIVDALVVLELVDNTGARG